MPGLSKRVAILGSTGSIGCNALEVVERLGEPFRAVALSGHRQIEKLFEQARRFGPSAVAITADSHDIDAATIHRIEQLGCRLYYGEAGLVEMVRRDDVDIVLAAIVGAAGLGAALAAVESGKTLALANKEALVVAGSILIPESRRRNVKLLPVDSEHSAIYQAMLAGRRDEVRRVILTASGGPFRSATREQIDRATVAEALNHPTWSMGSKITIDSATMFNKALELIEACWLFDLAPEQVRIVIHPESIVHSMVEFVDGSVIAQLSPPDMKTPIQYALTHPDRLDGPSRRMNWEDSWSLRFEPPDFQRFPALRLAYEVAAAGGTSGAVLNAANEVAVAGFLAGKIAFGGISRVVELTIDEHRVEQAPSLAALLSADRWGRKRAGEWIASLESGVSSASNLHSPASAPMSAS